MPLGSANNVFERLDNDDTFKFIKAFMAALTGDEAVLLEVLEETGLRCHPVESLLKECCEYVKSNKLNVPVKLSALAYSSPVRLYASRERNWPSYVTKADKTADEVAFVYSALAMFKPNEALTTFRQYVSRLRRIVRSGS